MAARIWLRTTEKSLPRGANPKRNFRTNNSLLSQSEVLILELYTGPGVTLLFMCSAVHVTEKTLRTTSPENPGRTPGCFHHLPPLPPALLSLHQPGLGNREEPAVNTQHHHRGSAPGSGQQQEAGRGRGLSSAFDSTFTRTVQT